MPPRALLVVAALAIATLAAGCIGPPGDDAQDIEQTDEPPARDPRAEEVLPDEIRGIDHVTHYDDIEAGAGIHVEESIAYVAGQDTGFYTVDVTDPANPRILGHVEDQFTRGVDLLHYENRTVAAAAAQSDGIQFIDVTDPEDPHIVGEILNGESAVHNVIAVPDTHIVYNSRSLDAPGVDVIDASDPENPEVANVLTDFACHDVRIGPQTERAYCAAVTETQIWDIQDPVEPQVITRIHNPSINIHHWATVTQDRDLLLIGDEFAGSTDAAAGCFHAHENPVTGGTLSDPVGALWFYDISDEQTPTPLSWIAPPLPEGNIPPTPCTAHFGEIIEDRDKVVVGWRAAGTVLVDFQDPAAPAILDVSTGLGDNWEAQYEGGYIFAGDTDRGIDVLSFTG